MPANNAKSLNPGRLPPRVFLVGDDPGVPPAEAVMYWCEWTHMNPDSAPEFDRDEPRPEAVPRLRRRRIVIHEPARPFEVNASICDDLEFDADARVLSLRRHAHTTRCRCAHFGDFKNDPPDVQYACQLTFRCRDFPPPAAA